MKPILTVFPAMWSLAAFFGCAQHTTPVAPRQQLTPGQGNFQAVWDAACFVLRGHGFVLDRQDRREGTITTHPLMSRHWFELWRKDAAYGKDLAESSLQTIYRRATVTIAPTSPGAETFRATVRVDVGRSDKKEIQITSTSEAFNLFTTVSPDIAEERSKGAARQTIEQSATVGGPTEMGMPKWLVELGRDADLETKLAAAILIEGAKRRAMRPE
jgi:hypothetical protein